MADWHLAKAESWAKIGAARERFVEDYNARPHLAHGARPDGRRSPSEVLGWVPGVVRHRPEELERAFFAARFSRVLDPLGYVRFRDWRIYGDEGLAKREAAIWLHEKTLTPEHAGQALPRYDVEYAPGDPGEAGKKLWPRSGARGRWRPRTLWHSSGCSPSTPSASPGGSKRRDSRAAPPGGPVPKRCRTCCSPTWTPFSAPRAAYRFPDGVGERGCRGFHE